MTVIAWTHWPCPAEHVVARMMIVSTLAGAAIFGSLVGGQLGRSAVSEINPSFYNQPETRFHADLVANYAPEFAPPPEVQAFDASYVQGLGRGCIRCMEYPEEYRPTRLASVQSFNREEPPQPDYDSADSAVEPSPSSTGSDRIEHYSHYAITADANQEVVEAPIEPTTEPADIGEDKNS